jgi:hypothetical protein
VIGVVLAVLLELLLLPPPPQAVSASTSEQISQTGLVITKSNNFFSNYKIYEYEKVSYLNLFVSVRCRSVCIWQLVVAKQFFPEGASRVFGFVSATLLQTRYHFFDKVIEAFRHHSSGQIKSINASLVTPVNHLLRNVLS